MDALALTSAAAHTHTIDNIAPLGLVAQTASLLGASRVAAALDRVQLAVLPCAETEEVVEGLGLLLAPELLNVLVGTHRIQAG